MKFKVHYKESLYFAIMLAISLCVYCPLGLVLFSAIVNIPGYLVLSMCCFFASFFLAIRFCVSSFFVGCITGNAIKVTRKQFPDVYELLENHSLMLGLKQVPDMYVLQGNGVLNAFACRFERCNFVVLYSDIFEMAYQEGMDAVSFIIGHELGHIKRKHVGFFKSFLILPAKCIPFLNFAYSRACEYTCDNIGYNLSSTGAINGLLILASGKKLYKEIDLPCLIHDAQGNKRFARWFSEIFMTHPHLINRLAALDTLRREKQKAEDSACTVLQEKVESSEMQQ